MDTPQRAAAYLRRSKADPQRISIGRQRDLCLAPAKTHGYETPSTSYLSCSASPEPCLTRPGLEVMLERVRSGTVHAVFISDDARLSREAGHMWLITEEFKVYCATLYVKGEPS